MRPTLITTLVTYAILSAIIVASLTGRGCSSLIEQAEAYLFNVEPPIPATLTDSARQVEQWMDSDA